MGEGAAQGASKALGKKNWMETTWLRRTRPANEWRGGDWKNSKNEKEENGDVIGLKRDQEGRRSHAGAFSAPTRSRRWPRQRPERSRSSPSVRCRPRVLFTEITELPLVFETQITPKFV